MASGEATTREAQPLEVHLVGIDIGHALTPPVHSWVVQSLGLPWHFYGTECPTIEDCLNILRSSKCAGVVVTMPWKSQIIKYLDRLDTHAKMLNACNCVYFSEDGALCGSNTDWIGIEGALRASAWSEHGNASQEHTVALVIGAGGAARAALYALIHRFGAKQIYVVNRDDDEVEQLIQDCEQITAGFAIPIIHVKSVDQARELQSPTCIIGSVPNFEPKTSEEKAVQGVLTSFLAREGEKRVMLDMCYKPRWTRNLKLAHEYGWPTVSGMDVVGWQVEALWRLWVGEEWVKSFDSEGMWKKLRATAEGSAAINLDT